VNSYLATAAVLNAAVAVLHIGCIIFGASWYRFMGAGEEMARLAESGSAKPAIITSCITLVFAIWSLYAASAAGMIGSLPLLRWVLAAVTAIYLLRGLAGFFLLTNPLGRTPEFWLWSSAICLALGLLHLIGLKQVWAQL